MATKRKYGDDGDENPSPTTTSQPQGEVPPGGNEPAVLPPSVVGTSQDPNRDKKED